MHTKKPVLFGVMFLTGVVLLGLSSWYTHYYLSPQNILLRSLGHIQSIQSFSYTGNLHLTYELPPDQNTVVKEPLSFSSGFVGMYSKQKNEDTPRISYSGTVNAGDITIAQLETKIINTNIYVQANKLADIGFVDNTKILGQWVFIDLAKLPQPLSNLFIIPFWKFDTKSLHISIAQAPITVVDVLDPEIIEGSPTYHYRYHIDPLLLTQLLPDSSTDLSNIALGDGEVWIDPQKEYIVGMTFSLKRKEVEHGVPQIKITGLINFTDINSSVSIEPPESSTELQNLLQNAQKK